MGSFTNAAFRTCRKIEYLAHVRADAPQNEQEIQIEDVLVRLKGCTVGHCTCDSAAKACKNKVSLLHECC